MPAPIRASIRRRTLTYTGDGSPMTDLVISLAASDDDAVEGEESLHGQPGPSGSTTGSTLPGRQQRSV